MDFKGIVVRISFLWVEGMAIFPFVFTRTRFPARVLLNHESIHLRQQLETGFIVFYIWYLTEYLIRLIRYRKHDIAYRRISFEREAFEHEANFSYLSTRPLWGFLRYI